MKYLTIAVCTGLFLLANAFSIETKNLNSSNDGRKDKCKAVTAELLGLKQSDKRPTYLDYEKLIKSRPRVVYPGDKISEIIKNDKFQYASIEKGVKLTLTKNGLKDEVIRKKQTIYLPYCLEENEQGHNEVESVVSDKMTGTKVKKNKKIKVSAFVDFGIRNLEQSSQGLRYNFTRVKAHVSKEFNQSHFVFTEISLASLFNFKLNNTKFSNLSNSVDFKIGYKKEIKKYSFSLEYDYVNFFTLDNTPRSIDFTSDRRSQFSLNQSYQVSSSLFVNFRFSYGLSKLKAQTYLLKLTYPKGDFTYSVFGRSSNFDNDLNNESKTKSIGLQIGYEF